MSCLWPMEQMGHEELIFCRMKEAGLQAIIAIHDTTLGPALGGTRMWPYPSEEEAIVDVLRLSRGMTLRATAAGSTWAGGKERSSGYPKTGQIRSLISGVWPLHSEPQRSVHHRRRRRH